MSKHMAYSNPYYINKIKGETNWDKASLQPTKDLIRDYLYMINEGKCYFCKGDIENASNNETIEHIVSKDKYPKFTYKPANLTLACADCNRIKNDVDVFADNVLLSENLDFNDYPFSSNNYIIIHPYLDEYFDYIEIDDIFYIAKGDELNKGKNTIEYYNLTRLSLAESKIKQIKKNQKNTSVARSILENKKYDLKEIDKVYVSGGFLKYLNRKINSKNKLGQSCIEAIQDLDTNKTYMFLLFRNLSIQYDKLTDEEIKNSELLKVSDFSKVINIIETVLNMLEEINSDIDDRRCIRTFYDINFSELRNFFKGYEERCELNIQLKILFKYNHIIKMAKSYTSICEIEDIMKQIKSDKKVLEDVKIKYGSVDNIESIN